MGAARALRLPYYQEEPAEAIGRAARTCLAEGVTACAEAGIGGTLFGHSPVELGAYQLARDKGLLPLRVQLMVSADRLRPVAAHDADGIPKALDLGLRTGFGDDWLSVGALKIYTDGGMMARTAALSAAYEGLDRTGQLQGDPGVLAQSMALERAERAPWPYRGRGFLDHGITLVAAPTGRWRTAPRCGPSSSWPNAPPSPGG